MRLKNFQQRATHSKMVNFISWTLILLLACCGDVLASSKRYVEVLKVTPEKASEDVSYRILVNLTSSLYECETRFLSVTIDTYEVNVKWKEFPFRSTEFINLASALSPSDIRIGGTYSNFLIFVPNGTNSSIDERNQKLPKNSYKYDSGLFDSSVNINDFALTGEMWDNLTTFTTQVGWDIMFDFNLFKWKDGLWDPTNADLLLNYSSQRGVGLPYLQLGNEPNSYQSNFNVSISPETLAKDYLILKQLISKYPLYASSGLYGPDVTNLNVPHGSVKYVSDFIKSGAYDTVAGITLHHYYTNGMTATLEEFVNITILDTMKSQLELSVIAVSESPVKLPILLTETSSCFGGGAPGLSNAYVAGFMWLDKLGLSAQYGISRVFRQTFLGTSYGLLADNMKPNPDFYLSVVFKRLIEGPVFNISIDPPGQHLRAYAHCARRKLYNAGALVIYYLNLHDNEAVLDLPQFQDADLDLYLFTPGDQAGLKSRYVRLNGDLLLIQNSDLPPLLPKPNKGPVTVTAMSFGFIVVPNANVPLCLNYFANSANKD